MALLRAMLDKLSFSIRFVHYSRDYKAISITRLFLCSMLMLAT